MGLLSATGLVRVLRAGSEAVSESQVPQVGAGARDWRRLAEALAGGATGGEAGHGPIPPRGGGRVSDIETGVTRARGRWVEPVRDVWSLGANPRSGRAAEGPGPAWV